MFYFPNSLGLFIVVAPYLKATKNVFSGIKIGQAMIAKQKILYGIGEEHHITFIEFLVN